MCQETERDSEPVEEILGTAFRDPRAFGERGEAERLPDKIVKTSSSIALSRTLLARKAVPISKMRAAEAIPSDTLVVRPWSDEARSVDRINYRMKKSEHNSHILDAVGPC